MCGWRPFRGVSPRNALESTRSRTAVLGAFCGERPCARHSLTALGTGHHKARAGRSRPRCVAHGETSAGHPAKSVLRQRTAHRTGAAWLSFGAQCARSGRGARQELTLGAGIEHPDMRLFVHGSGRQEDRRSKNSPGISAFSRRITPQGLAPCRRTGVSGGEAPRHQVSKSTPPVQVRNQRVANRTCRDLFPADLLAEPGRRVPSPTVRNQPAKRAVCSRLAPSRPIPSRATNETECLGASPRAPEPVAHGEVSHLEAETRQVLLIHPHVPNLVSHDADQPTSKVLGRVAEAKQSPSHQFCGLQLVVPEHANQARTRLRILHGAEGHAARLLVSHAAGSVGRPGRQIQRCVGGRESAGGSGGAPRRQGSCSST